MSASAPCQSELPTEILEKVFLHLPGQDIIKMEVVSRHFQDLVHSSPIVRYRRELFSAGLSDNPRSPCELAERRKLCEEYVHKWSGAAKMVENIRKFPPGPFSGWYSVTVLSKNLLVSLPAEDHGFTFLRSPLKASEEWSIPQPPFKIFSVTAYVPENVLAVAELRERSICIHLLNLRNGSPYREPPFNVITSELPPWVSGLQHHGGFVITGSRVMMYVYCANPDLQGDADTWSMRVWDWKTGDLVLDLLASNGYGWIQGPGGCRPQFIDEFRLMISTYNPYNPTDDSQCFVFNTLIPQDDPSNPRRFGIPSGYRIHVDRDGDLGTPDMEEPFVADPAQAILVVELARIRDTIVLVVVRTQVLIEHACSPRADHHVPWDEWVKGAVVMEVTDCCSYVHIFVHGTKLVVMQRPMGRHEFLVDTFDLSQRGCSSLQLSNKEGGGTQREALFKEGRSLKIEGRGAGPWAQLTSLGDGSMFNLLAMPRNKTPSYSALYVWELV